MKKKILQLTLENAVAFKGKANPKAVINKIIPILKDKSKLKAIGKEVATTIKKINKLYGFCQETDHKGPRINLGPCGPFANEFYKIWNRTFDEKINISQCNINIDFLKCVSKRHNHEHNNLRII